MNSDDRGRKGISNTTVIVPKNTESFRELFVKPSAEIAFDSAVRCMIAILEDFHSGARIIA